MSTQPLQSSRASSRLDPSWKYVHPVEENNTNNIMCNFCGKVMKGGITRAKERLMGKPDNVSKCPKEVKDKLWVLHNQKTKQESEKVQNLRELDLENLGFGLFEDNA